MALSVGTITPPPAVKLLATGIVTKRKQTPRQPTAGPISMVQYRGPEPERTMVITTNHETIRNVIEQAGSRMVSVTFTKADGTERQLTFNPRHKGQILGTGHPIKDPVTALNNFKIMDINLGQWRSFDARRVYRVKFEGRVVEMQPEG